MRVVSIHIGREEPLNGRPGKTSAIRKRAVEGPVELRASGLVGDVQVDRRYHGGEHKALCAYSLEYYPQWHRLTGTNMPPGSFGENLVLEGLTDDALCIGDVYAFGGAQIQVTGPRGPCSTLSAHWGAKDFHLQTKRERKTGLYLRVVQPGFVEPGPLKLLQRRFPEWTLPAFWDAVEEKSFSPAQAEELRRFEGLDPDWHGKLRSRGASG